MPPKKDKAKGGPAAAPEAQPAAPLQHPEDQCVLCLGEIDLSTEERFAATCNLCGTASMHYDCAVDHLQQCLPIMFSNSSAQKRYAVLMKQRPKYFMQVERCPCPAGAGRAKREGAAGCAGFTIDAEIYRPVKAPAAPVPQPARPAKQQQQQQQAAAAAGKKAAAPTGGVGTARKRRTPAGSSMRGTAEAFGAAAASTSSGRPPGRPPPSASSPAGIVGGGGGGGRGSFQGPRPPELTMCREVAASGRCYIHNCRFAHSEAELRQREDDFAAERAARKQQRQEDEAAAQRAAARRALEEAEAAQAVLDAIEEREMLLGVTQPTLALVKGHKRAACLHTLLAYGFGEPEAEAAVEAAGADQRFATQMLFNKEPCTGFQPVTVDGEIQDLLTFAAELGLPSPLQAVEDQLVAADGDWEAAREALQAVALEAAAVAATTTASVADAGSWDEAAWAAPAEVPLETAEPVSTFAPSQPGTPNPAAAVPHWAADAHSAGGTSASPAAHSPHAPPSEAASDAAASWHQPLSATGSAAATPTAAAAPSSGAFADAQHWHAQPQPHPVLHQQPGMPALPPAGFEGFAPAPQQYMFAPPAPFGSPVPLPGTLPPPAAAAPGLMPPTAYPAPLPTGASPSEYAHGFQAGLAAAMLQLQQAQQAQQAQQLAYAQQEQLHQAYSQAAYAAQQHHGSPTGQPAAHAIYQQLPSPSAGHGPPPALAPEAFFPAAQPQPQSWQQQPAAQPPSPQYQQAATAFQQLSPHAAYQQGAQPGGAALYPQQAQQAQQDTDEVDAMLSLMGIG